MMRWSVPFLIACGSDPEGAWTVETADFSANECLLDGNLLPAGGFEVSVIGDQIFLQFSEEEIGCDLSGSSFTCEDEAVDSEIQRDATLTTWMATEGSVGKTLTATRTGRVECQGADCSVIEDLGSITYPCSFTMEITAVRAP